jgi:hypothetical protein
MKSILFVLLCAVCLTLLPMQSSAQCAMCKVTVENNVSSGETSIGAGLNKGILYLLAMPYTIIGVVAFLWYRNSKRTI